MPCSVPNLGCGITVYSERLTVMSKWDILKLFVFDKLNVLPPAAQCDGQTPEPWLREYDKSELGCTNYE